MPPVRYSPLVAPTPKEFVEPNSSDAFIWWLFRHRCVMCHQSASEINEIQPRGRSKKNIFDWKNRVTLCQECHRAFHHHGVTAKKIEEMQQKRTEFLIAFDRSEYVEVKLPTIEFENGSVWEFNND